MVAPQLKFALYRTWPGRRALGVGRGCCRLPSAAQRWAEQAAQGWCDHPQGQTHMGWCGIYGNKRTLFVWKNNVNPSFSMKKHFLEKRSQKKSIYFCLRRKRRGANRSPWYLCCTLGDEQHTGPQQRGKTPLRARTAWGRSPRHQPHRLRPCRLLHQRDPAADTHPPGYPTGALHQVLPTPNRASLPAPQGQAGTSCTSRWRNPKHRFPCTNTFSA